MRSTLVIAFILLSLPFCFRRPYIGILMWCIVSYVNPHRFAWGAAYNFPAAQLVAVATLLGWLFSSNKGRLPQQRETYLMLLLWLNFALTTVVALYPDEALNRLEFVSKILLMTVMALFIIDDRRKFEYFMLVLGLSVAAIAVKGGIWGIVTGAKYMLWGPRGSMIADNNDVALALNMVTPVIWAFTKIYRKKWQQIAFYSIFGLTVFSIILTQSRGGFVGLLAIAGIMVLKSRGKFLIIPALLMLGPVFFYFLPEHYKARVQTLENYDTDLSALGRINAWQFAFNLSLERPFTGGGFECFTPELFLKYAPNPADYHAAHSNYFLLLGEHGYPALLLFLTLLVAALLKLRRLEKISAKLPALQWVTAYSSALQSGLVGYAISGAFLGRAYFDLFYHFLAATIILHELLRKEIINMVLANAGVQQSVGSRSASPTT
ncbi:putative O-glycosylation ligase, exosortase A system-associated [candidate division KSB1 bacterium]|nr:putative O-glycosylation ligase, exosortase A system-associated [candidate division KSB1 bacterium]